jgi:orotidine-5'-phosphate decarboxylase
VADEFEKIIPQDKSLIAGADVGSRRHYVNMCMGLRGVKGIGGIKLGFSMGLDGLARQVDLFHDIVEVDYPVYLTYVPGHVPAVIYDHQKAGNDIPDMGKVFAKKLKDAGVDAAILFPFAGPLVQEKWTKTCQDAGLHVIIGGIMTHPNFLRSEDGYIADDAPMRIYELAVEHGIRHFVVPGNKPEWVEKVRIYLDSVHGAGNYVLYAPGFVKQGGSVARIDAIAGPNWHAIVARDVVGELDAPHTAEIVKIKAESLISEFKLAA